MADVSKLNVAGTTYNIKDATARDKADKVASDLNEAVTDINTDIDSIKQAIADTNAFYTSSTETITFTYGVI